MRGVVLGRELWRPATSAQPPAGTTAEASAFGAFYSSADQLNRGLDAFMQATTRGAKNDEDARNRLKASRIMKGGEHYEAADAALKARGV